MIVYRLNALNAAAGPSRLGLALRVLPRGLPGMPLPGMPLPVRFASTASTSRLAARSRPRPKLTEQQWPWRVLNPPRHAGQVEEERVIYSRPSSNPKIFWAMAVLYGAAVSIFLILPSPEDARRAGRGGEDEGTILGIPTGSFMSYLAGGAITGFTVLGFFGAAFPTRIVTRLSLIRSRPIGAPAAQSKKYLRMQHLGHAMMWGKRSLPRELPVEDVKVSILLGRPTADGQRERLPTLDLKVTSPRSNSKFSFDAYKYRLDFRETPTLKTEKGELVMSVARIEDVFGTLEVANPYSEKDIAALKAKAAKEAEKKKK